MNRFRGLVLAGTAAAALIAAAPAEANGWHRRGPSGGAVAGAIIGGLALGALAGAAVAAPPPPVYYAPPPPVVYRPAYGW